METTILFAPLVGALICGFGWKIIGRNGRAVAADRAAVPRRVPVWIVFLSFDGQTEQIQILRWIESGTLAPTGRSGWTV